MITIYPRLLAIVKHRPIYQTAIEGIESQCLEAQKLPIVGIIKGVASEEQILDPYTITPRPIYTRLVRCHHTGKLRLRILLHTNALRPLMDIQKVTYTMARAVEIIGTKCPHRHTGKHIELSATSPGRKNSTGESHITFKHSRIVATHIIGWIPESNRTGYVGRTIKIGSARIDKQKTLGSQLDISFRSSRIVDYRPMSTIAGYGFKTQIKIKILSRSVMREYSVDINFSCRLARTETALNLHKALYERRSIALHSTASPLNLYLIPHRFSLIDRQRGCHCPTPAKGINKSGSDRSEVNSHLLAFWKIDKKLIDHSIRRSSHPAVSKICPNLICQLRLFDKQNGHRLRNIEVGDHNRIARHIGRPDIEQPSYLGKITDKR